MDNSIVGDMIDLTNNKFSIAGDRIDWEQITNLVRINSNSWLWYHVNNWNLSLTQPYKISL